MTAWCRILGEAGPVVAARRNGELWPVRSAGQPVTDLHPIVRGELDPASLTFGEPVALIDAHLLAPIGSFPRNIFCIGKNYREHALEFTTSGFDSSGTAAQDLIPTAPIVFSKPFTSVIGPGDLIDPHPHLTSMLDYEAELAVVIGRGGRDIALADALDHVFGYTIGNDVTARDRQRHHRQWLLGKGMDTFCPMGPAVVTAEEIDLANAVVECRVNGELRQKASVADLIFDVPTLIRDLSAGMTLVPGDVIATGTPAGVGIGFDPPRFLKPGDEVAATIEPIGTLTNRIG
ncbi:MAG: fumarylacetoacetate hydrolase family protein [Acidimicrobiia bacterium]|nr:fumarylacetoacetate hydrolase family protein [Acidimicrobiia bacterium]